MTILQIVIMGLFILSCSKDDNKNGNSNKLNLDRRTIAIYMAGENSLSSYIASDIQEMLLGTSEMGEEDNLVIYVDDTKSPRIYEINSSTFATSMSGLVPVFTYTENMNSCLPSTLDGFLDYVQQYYTSKSYGLILWSHASGWIPPSESNAAARVNKSFGIDNNRLSTSDYGTEMSIEDIDSICKRHGKFDFILFDACFMQNVETAYELRDAAEYIIASPAEIPGPGAPYNKLIPLFFQENFDADALTRTYYDEYKKQDSQYGVVISAVKTANMEAFADSTAKYVARHKADLLNINGNYLLNYYIWNKYSRNKYPDFYDIKGVMKTVLTDEEYKSWETELNKVVVSSYATDMWYSSIMDWCAVERSQYSGITMHIPLDKYEGVIYSDSYHLTEWAKRVWK